MRIEPRADRVGNDLVTAVRQYETVEASMQILSPEAGAASANRLMGGTRKR